MRVPSFGLPLDERRIVREGYRLAERLLADYRDPPTIVERLGTVLTRLRALVFTR
jgi:hypothetical protein